LLSEPQRAENGYRLYTADDLLRLHRVRQLQSLGLSLSRIKEVLGEPNQHRSLRTVLEFVLSELNEQINTLQTRRDRIEKLLAGENLEDLEKPIAPLPLIEATRQYLETQQISLSPAAWEQELKMWDILAKFNWPGDLSEIQREVIAFAETHPEIFQQQIALMERFAALANSPEDAPEVDALVKDFSKLYTNPVMQKFRLNLPWLDDTMGQVIGELWGRSLSPAQLRFSSEVKRLTE
jgi:DNA-binding transcriptional MerR regulator